MRFSKASPSCIGDDGGLRFDELVHDLRRSGIVFVIFVVKSIALAFEGLGVEGAKIDLVIGALCEISDGTWAETLRQPNKPSKAYQHRVFVTAS
jgi:hypothetical protein